jgi:hypothetical protein
MRVLNKLGQDLEDEFAAEMSDSCCSCHISPPCSYCIHPGNPANLEESDDCWDEVEETPKEE